MQSIQSLVLSAVDERLFELILFPTEKCNFRCTYCYEDFKVGKMARPVIDGVKALIDHKLGTIRDLTVQWFGGEPLLAVPVIEEISEHILSRISTRPDVAYRAIMTTNGYLLGPAVYERMVSLGVCHFQVSFDGDEDVHDTTRRTADASGDGFRRIWENLRSIKRSRSSAEVVLRLHLTAENTRSIQALVERLVCEFGGDDRFWVFFKPVSRLGGPNDASLPILGEEEAERLKCRLAGTAAPRLQVFNERFDRGPYVCYASKANSLAVRADGTIAKCTVALSDESNRVGRLLEDGRIAFDRERLMSWLRGLESLDPGELACPHRAGKREQPGVRRSLVVL